MNKQKGIIIGILALAVTMMVGYAKFSETITINGTATAKGEFDMTVACNTGIDSKLGTLSSLGLAPEVGYKNDSCTVEGNAVSLNVELEYPGARRYFTIKMTNTGTIEAVLNLSQDLQISGKVCYDDNSNMKIEEADECVNETNSTFDRFNMFQQDLAFERADGTIINSSGSEEQLGEFYDMNTGIIKLKPGQSMYFLLDAISDQNSHNENSFMLTSNLSYSFNWKQVTN